MANHRSAITDSLRMDDAPQPLALGARALGHGRVGVGLGVLGGHVLAVLDGYLVEVERLRAAEPIVRTVGDLTARHIGKRVRIGGGRALRLDGLTHTGRGDVKLDISDAQKSGWLVCERDTPCEVLQ